jgi:hypothetical protein
MMYIASMPLAAGTSLGPCRNSALLLTVAAGIQGIVPPKRTR